MAGEEGFEPSAYGFGDSAASPSQIEYLKKCVFSTVSAVIVTQNIASCQAVFCAETVGCIYSIFDLITNLGFPIACVVVLAVFAWKMIHTNEQNQKEREDKLYFELGECRQINDKAIQIIA